MNSMKSQLKARRPSTARSGMIATVAGIGLLMACLCGNTVRAQTSAPTGNRWIAKNQQQPQFDQLGLATHSDTTPTLKLSTGETTQSTVRQIPLEKILVFSNQLDALVDARLTAAEIQPAPLASDEVFVRRAYLDMVGRIPTLAETRKFLTSGQDQKRSLLIDELLDSYGYVSRQFNFWADVLRVKTDLRNVAGQPYVDYIKDSLSQNKPYDEFVREMLIASGPNLKRGNGAVGYYLRDNDMPEDNMSNTVRIFLGTRLECAQCHDHPYDVWSQRDYFEMVAFTGGIQFRHNPIDSLHARELGKLRSDRSMSQQERQALRKVIEPMLFGISGDGTGLARLPEDYSEGEGDPLEIVTAKTMFDKEPLVDAQVPVEVSRKRSRRKVNKKNPQQIPNARPIGSRDAYADWMTSQENPRFATVIANRMWKQALGLGLVEPVDVFMDETVASNPKLLAQLTNVMIELDYDLKQFLRCLYNTNTYQRIGDSREVTDPFRHRCNGPLVRRMEAEQVWDSLLSLAISDIDRRDDGNANKSLRYLPYKDMYEGYERLRELDGEEIMTLADAYIERRNGKRGAMMKAMSEVFDEEVVDDKIKNFAGEMESIMQRLKSAKAEGNRFAVRRLAAERKELVEYQRALRISGDLLRASELPSPAKPGHFLREFGQSDREQIENANQEAAVTQSLSLMNGIIEKSIARFPQSVLMKEIHAAEKPAEKVRTTYLTMLSRQPEWKELKFWLNAIEEDQQVAVSDLIWTLANSTEFLFVK